MLNGFLYWIHFYKENYLKFQMMNTSFSFAPKKFNTYFYLMLFGNVRLYTMSLVLTLRKTPFRTLNIITAVMLK